MMKMMKQIVASITITITIITSTMTEKPDFVFFVSPLFNLVAFALSVIALTVERNDKLRKRRLVSIFEFRACGISNGIS
jgi:hypothetical protein